MHTRVTRTGGTIVSALAGGLLLVLLPATTAIADTADAPAAPPQLSITITDDREATGPAEQLSYSIVIENLGTTDASGLSITQSVPEGMTFGSADSDGTLNAALVSWTLDVKAAETATLATTMSVGETPDELLRLATVACAHSSPTEPPIVCASDSDLLPAGAAAAEAADAESASAAPDATGWIVGGAVAVAGLAALAVFAILRRRRSIRSAVSASA